MLKTVRLGLILAASAVSLTGCGDKSTVEKMHDGNARVGSGVVLYEGINSNTLYLGEKTAGAAQQCVRAVVVKDAELACANNRCDVKAFYLPVRPVFNGQRALHVVPCDADPELVKGYLLTDRSDDDSSAILYFQPNRSGDELFKQSLGDNGHYEIELPTEASVGILRLSNQGAFIWDELVE